MQANNIHIATMRHTHNHHGPAANFTIYIRCEFTMVV